MICRCNCSIFKSPVKWKTNEQYEKMIAAVPASTSICLLSPVALCLWPPFCTIPDPPPPLIGGVHIHATEAAKLCLPGNVRL